MMELSILKYKSIKDFAAEKIMLGIKSCLLFAGDGFDNKPELSRLKNLFIDFFHREPVPAVRLQGLEHVLMFTAHEDKIYLRSYRSARVMHRMNRTMSQYKKLSTFFFFF